MAFLVNAADASDISVFHSHKVYKHVSMNQIEDHSHTDQEYIYLYLWKHKNESYNHLACDFDYIPLKYIKIDNGLPVHWEVLPLKCKNTCGHPTQA